MARSRGQRAGRALVLVIRRVPAVAGHIHALVGRTGWPPLIALCSNDGWALRALRAITRQRPAVRAEAVAVADAWLDEIAAMTPTMALVLKRSIGGTNVTDLYIAGPGAAIAALVQRRLVVVKDDIITATPLGAAIHRMNR